jgi:tetratricopeptide (TPR) repeat protein
MTDFSGSDDSEAFVEAYGRGFHHYRSGRYQEAEHAFSRAASLKPDDFRAWEMLACTLSNSGRFEESLQAFEKAERLGHECDQCWYNRWVVLCQLQRTDEAKAAYQRVLALRKELARAHPEVTKYERSLVASHFEMADWLANDLSQPQEAEEVYRRALALAEQLARAHPGVENQGELAIAFYNVGIHYRATGRIDAAEENHRSALLIWEALARSEPGVSRFHSQAAACHNHLGILYRDTGRLQRAEAAFQKALAIREQLARLEPDNVENTVYLGGTQCNLGNVARDRWESQRALAWYDQSLHTLQTVLQEQGSIDIAEQFSAHAQQGRATVQAREGAPATPSRFRRWFGRLLGRDSAAPAPPQFGECPTFGCRPPGPPPQFPDHEVSFPAAVTGGIELFQGDHYQETLEVLDHFLALFPGDAGGRFWKARTLGRLRRYPDALRALEDALKLEPDLIPAYYEKSDILRSLNRAAEALQAIDKVLERDPEHAPAWYLKGLILGRFLDELGGQEMERFDPDQNDRAVDAFDQAILLRPDFLEARLFKGKTLYWSAHAAMASCNVLAHVTIEAMGAEAAQAYLLPSRALFGGYFNRARESFDEAIRIKPDDSRPWYEKGKLLIDLMEGWEEPASEAFARAGELRPELAGPWFELARLSSRRKDRSNALAHLRRALAADPNVREQAKQDFDWLSEQDLQAL